MNLKSVMLGSQSRKGIDCLFSFIWYLGKGKTIEIEQLLPWAGRGREEGIDCKGIGGDTWR